VGWDAECDSGEWTRGFVFLVVRLYWQHDKSLNKCRDVSCATFWNTGSIERPVPVRPHRTALRVTVDGTSRVNSVSENYIVFVTEEVICMLGAAHRRLESLLVPDTESPVVPLRN